MSWRDIKAEVRPLIHEAFQVPVRVKTPDSSVSAANARIHNKVVLTGDLSAGSDRGYAETMDRPPRLIFLVSEFSGPRLSVVCTEDNEAYLLDSQEPYDGLTVTFSARRIPVSEFPGVGLDANLPWGGMEVT